MTEQEFLDFTNFVKTTTTEESIENVPMGESLEFLKDSKIAISGTSGIVTIEGECLGINGFNDNLPVGEPNHVFDITNETTNIQYLWQGTTYSPNGGWANIHIRKARGTKANPQAILKGDYIMSWGMRGYKGNEFASSSAAFQAISTENFTPSANGTALLFQVTKNGFTDNRINGLYINEDGSVAVNPNTNPDYTISTVAKLDNSKGGYAGAATLNPSSTLNPKSHQFILLTSSLAQTLPTASGVLGSVFEIKNISGSPVSISAYKDENNTTITSVPNNATIRLVAINNEWHKY